MLEICGVMNFNMKKKCQTNESENVGMCKINLLAQIITITCTNFGLLLNQLTQL